MSFNSRPPRNYHLVDVAGSKDHWYARCHDCELDTRWATRREAQDCCDAHRLFTHETGGRECGRAWCVADRTVRRIRKRETPIVTVEVATPEDAVRIAIKELKKALAQPDHFGVYVHSALIWLRGLGETDDEALERTIFAAPTSFRELKIRPAPEPIDWSTVYDDPDL